MGRSSRGRARIQWLVALFLLAVPIPLCAQSNGTIRGRVLESGSNRPVASAQVNIEGTTRGALTDAAGRFELTEVTPGTHTLQVQSLGFTQASQQVTVAAGQTAEVTFELSVSAVSLDEIVVTGTAVAASKRTLGNSITTVDASQITQQTAVTNLTELLQAKSPGVQILTNSGTLGAAADIRIRGAGSLTHGAQPRVHS